MCCLYEYYRWTYQEFFSRYRVLMKQKDVLPDRKKTCKNLLEKLIEVFLIAEEALHKMCNFHRPIKIHKLHVLYCDLFLGPG